MKLTREINSEWEKTFIKTKINIEKKNERNRKGIKRDKTQKNEAE